MIAWLKQKLNGKQPSPMQIAAMERVAQRTKLRQMDIEKQETMHHLFLNEADRLKQEDSTIERDKLDDPKNFTGWEELRNRIRQRVQESVAGQGLGTAWPHQLFGLTFDQIFRQGFPLTFNQFLGLTADDVASNDNLRNQVLGICRMLYSTHPHAKAVVNTAVAYVVGAAGWDVEPKPRKTVIDETVVKPIEEVSSEEFIDDIELVGSDIPLIDDNEFVELDEEEPSRPQVLIDERLKAEITRRFKKYKRKGKIHPQCGWRQFWREVYRRKKMEGEIFIHLVNDEDEGYLTPRIREPEDIKSPHGEKSGRDFAFSKDKFDQDAHGVRVKLNDHACVEGYWYWPPHYNEATFIPADNMIHIKEGVGLNIRRGIPYIFTVRHYLSHFDRWIAQALKHQRVQSLVAILRQWDKATPAQIRNVVDSKKVLDIERQTPSGNAREYQTTELLPIIDAPKGMTMTAFTPSGNHADADVLARRTLLAVASGANQSEAMVTADGSNANYASTRITTLIPMRGFQSEQEDMKEIVLGFYEIWIQTESVIDPFYKRIDNEEQLEAEISCDELPDFEAELNTNRSIYLYTHGVSSRQSAQKIAGLDPLKEKEYMREEIEDEELEITKLKAQYAVRGVSRTSFSNPRS